MANIAMLLAQDFEDSEFTVPFDRAKELTHQVTVIGSKAGVLPGKIVRPGVWWGIPIQPLAEYKRLNAHLGRLPRLREEVKELRERLRILEEKTS